jgi:LytS/YehU family sensor histidine kinase
MNPHFIFNTLNAITGHIISQNQWKSVNYLSIFATLVRQVLENSKHSFLPLAQEIEMLRSYIELELLRLGDTYHIEVEVDSKIDQNSYDIPPMLIQPFVENAIIHGVAPNEKGTIKITIHSKNENLLEIVVEDNGVGRSFAATKPALLGVEKSAFGIKSIENHIHLINKNYKTKITLKIEDLYEKGEPTGTKVLISLPRINKASF